MTTNNLTSAEFQKAFERSLKSFEEPKDAGIEAVLEIHQKYNSTHALLAVAVYNPSFLLSETSHRGYLLDERISTACAAVFVRQKPLAVVVAIRGTLFEAQDIIADVSLAYGFRCFLPRFTTAKRVCKAAIKKYGKNNISVVGHSLGATVCIDLCRKFDLPGTAFQPGTAFIGLGSEIAWNLFRRWILKKPPQVLIVCTKGFDPIACLAPFTCAGDVYYVDVKCKNRGFLSRTAHFICPCLWVSHVCYMTHRMDNFVC